MIMNFMKKLKNKRVKVEIVSKRERKKAEIELEALIRIGNQLSNVRVQKGGIKPIFNIVKMLSDKIIYTYMLNYSDDMLFFVKNDWFKFLSSADKEFNIEYDTTKYSILEKEFIIQLGIDPVMSFPWKMDRLEDTLKYCGIDENMWQEQSDNHCGKIYIPFGLTIVNNGKHSVFSGICKSVGEFKINEDSQFDIFDMTQYYNFMKFDGIDFVSIETGKIVYRPKVRELGQIFEIGRIIKDSDVDFIEYKVKKYNNN